MRSYKYVIVGNSAAAVGAIEAIRAVDAEGSIAVVSDEPYHCYSRPLISAYLTGEKSLDQIKYRPDNFYHSMDVTPLLGVVVRELNAEACKLTTNQGEAIYYEKLLLATGAKPVLPRIAGLSTNNTFTFTALTDMQLISQSLSSCRACAVIGGGLIGLQAAETLAKLKKQVTVIELMPRVLAPALDEVGSNMVSKKFDEMGVQILTSVSALEITRSQTGRPTGVVLSNGARVPADMVIIAVGVVPRAELAVEAGIEANPGILVNERMETSMPGVYAAGDVTVGRDLISGDLKVIPIWPNAYLQGRCAGFNMAGKSVRFIGSLPMNAVHFFGFSIVSVGVHSPPKDGYEVMQKYVPEKGYYRKLVLRDGIIQGFVAAGNGVDRAGVITGLIRSKVYARPFAEPLLNGSGLICLPDDLRRQRIAGNRAGLNWFEDGLAGTE